MRPDNLLDESEARTSVRIVLSKVSPTAWFPGALCRLPFMVLVVGMYVMVSWRMELLYISGQWLQAGWIRDIHAPFALKQPTNNAIGSTIEVKEADTNVEAYVVLYFLIIWNSYHMSFPKLKLWIEGLPPTHSLPPASHPALPSCQRPSLTKRHLITKK